MDARWPLLSVRAPDATGGGGQAPGAAPPGSPAPATRWWFRFNFGADAQGGRFIVAEVKNRRMLTLAQLEKFAEHSLRRRLPGLNKRCPSGAKLLVAAQVFHHGCARWYPLVADGQLCAIKEDQVLPVWFYVNSAAYESPLSGAPPVLDFQARATYNAITRKDGALTVDTLKAYCKVYKIDWLGELYGGAIEDVFSERSAGTGDDEPELNSREVPEDVWQRVVREVHSTHKAALDAVFHAPRLAPPACGDRHMGFVDRTPGHVGLLRRAYRLVGLQRRAPDQPSPPASLVRGMRDCPRAAELCDVDSIKQRLAEAEGQSRSLQCAQMGWNTDGSKLADTGLSVMEHDVTEAVRLWGDPWVTRYAPGMEHVGHPLAPACPDDVGLMDDAEITVFIGDDDVP